MISPMQAVYINLGYWGCVLVVIGLLLWWQRRKARAPRQRPTEWPDHETLKAIIRRAVDEDRLTEAEAMLDAHENGAPVTFPPEVELPEGAAPGLPGEFCMPEEAVK